MINRKIIQNIIREHFDLPGCEIVIVMIKYEMPWCG